MCIVIKRTGYSKAGVIGYKVFNKNPGGTIASIIFDRTRPLELKSKHKAICIYDEGEVIGFHAFRRLYDARHYKKHSTFWAPRWVLARVRLSGKIHYGNVGSRFAPTPGMAGEYMEILEVLE